MRRKRTWIIESLRKDESLKRDKEEQKERKKKLEREQWHVVILRKEGK
jgi:hypothetical protein